MIPVLFRSATADSLIECPENMQITKHFKLYELANTSGKKDEEQYIISSNSILFMNMIEDFRELYAKPIAPTSCFRQKDFNASVGGDPRSAHLQACALDFVDKYSVNYFNVVSYWLQVCRNAYNTGSVNIYKEGNYYRYHLESFSDKFYGYEESHIRCYVSQDMTKKLKERFTPLGYEVTYNGK